jgi:methylenetetrahydrofolate dehydrogenase (NADP+)/methenyltetrahydrofolate cyclohydrolase
MAAKILDGRKISAEILGQLRSRINTLKKKGITPKLDILLVGDNAASEIYVKAKMKASEETGMKAELHMFGRNAKQEDVIRLIEKLNADRYVHGILVQLPLPSQMDEQKILDTITITKDVDGLTTCSLGRLMAGDETFEPCTPKGIMKMLEHERIPIEGKNAVVIGRSNIVGKPLLFMLIKRNATATMCHSKTSDLKSHTKNADILFAAVGKANFVTADMVKKDAVVIDVGTNRMGSRILGDVDFDRVRNVASYITPVPGGVGPLTVAMVLENTVISAERMLQK